MTQIKQLEILVIEDNEQYMKDAQAFFSERAEVRVTYVTTYKDAVEKMSNNPFDGIITDLFFPTGYEGIDTSLNYRIATNPIYYLFRSITGGNYQYVIDRTRKIEKLRDDVTAGETLAPLGLSVSNFASTVASKWGKKLPVVVCTSESNHAVGVEETINYLARTNGGAGGVVTDKDWESAYGILSKTIELGSLSEGVKMFYQEKMSTL